MVNMQFISAITGYLSIACWIVVFAPQLYENWKRKSSDSLSLHFILIWIVGDLFNLVGVVLQNLLFTMLLLAIYYTLADVALLWQMFYYRNRDASSSSQYDERVLLQKNANEHTLLLTEATTARLVQDEPQASNGHNRLRKTVLYCILPVLSIIAIGLVHRWISVDAQQNRPHRDYGTIQLWPQVFGYISAICYVGARIPQIILNFRNKSCEGLSMLMFIYCVLGNITYCASIFFYSLDYTYLLINLPWLIGSGGTLFFDFVIFWQFYHYQKPVAGPNTFETTMPAERV
ncbi:PQ loop repeat-domain-containing protein [Syncephalis fuscata]|nr:PQ loop repeat-domain-containing protein [Syncephalis fuscata]